MKKEYIFKKLLFLLFVLIFSGSLVAQNITNYTFSATSGTYTPLVGGTTMAFSGGSADDGWFNNIPIGFTFVYMGVPYTTLSASTNGFVTLGNILTSSVPGNLLATGTPRPIIAPLWDDLDVQVNTNFSYKTTGTAPNRVFTAEWLNQQWNWSATGNTISFQMILYEATSAVEFVYRDEGGTLNSPSASIGITGVTTGAGSYLSLDGTGTSPNVSSTVETTTLAVKPATGQTYTFTPGQSVPTAPTDLTFTAVTGTSMTLNWLDQSLIETNYGVFRSLDDINYTLVAMLPANSTTYNATGLIHGTTYYWKIYAYNEGKSSTELSGNQTTLAGTVGGTKTIGPSGDYPFLTTAFADITANGLLSSVNLVLQADYVSTGETFPIVPSKNASASKTITIYPAVSGLSIISANATATLSLDGSNYITIDGRPNRIGTTPDLKITNTSTSGNALRFINDACFNTFSYIVFEGVNTSTTGGVILFSTTTATTGNDNNTIENSTIKDGATTPTNGIYATGTAGKENNNIGINNCKFVNMWNASSAICGINIATNNFGWSIVGNSFYQTASRNLSGNTYYGIYISNNSGYAFNIENNYIGGTDQMCGGTPMTFTGTGVFLGMYLSTASNVASNVNGNVIKNIEITSSSTSTSFGGIRILNGAYNVGTAAGNVIGSSTEANSIKFTLSGSGSQASGITTGTGGTAQGPINIENNIIGGISLILSGTPATQPQFRALSCQSSGTTLAGHYYNISNNLIGSETIANSITSNCNNAVYGMALFGGSSSMLIQNTVTNNVISNLSNTNAAGTTSSTVVGIHCQGSGLNPYYGVYNVSGNIVKNLSNAGQGTIYGINFLPNGNPNQVIANNDVFNITHSHATTNSPVYGIAYQGPATGTNLISRNRINNLSMATNSINAGMVGVLVGGTTTSVSVQNNMVSLGNAMSNGNVIYGIIENDGTNNFYFNSVYIGGTTATSNTNTFAFYSNAITNPRNFKNNIFVNKRNTEAGTGKNYVIRVAGTAPNPAGLQLDYNLYQSGGTAGVFGLFNSADVLDIDAWKTAVGQDANSFVDDPLFVDAANNDLHVGLNSPIDAMGVDIPSITVDFDGQLRAGLSPVDIGCDAGNFDVTPPTIVSFNPADGSSGHPVGDNIVITFSEKVRKTDNSPIDASVVTFKQLPGNTDVPFSINYANKVLTVIPNSALLGSTQYIVTVTGVEDMLDNALTGPNSTTFTTGSTDFTAPLFVSAVVQNAAPADVVATFDENVKLTSAAGFTINVDGSPVAINSYSGNNTTNLTFTLATPVVTHQTVTIQYNDALGNVTDASNNPLASFGPSPVTNNVKSSEKDFLTFAFLQANNPGLPSDFNAVIGTNTLTFIMPKTADISNLIATFTTSPYTQGVNIIATPQVSGVTANNFNNPITYTVIAEDGSTKAYNVIINFYYNLPLVETFDAATFPADWSQAQTTGVTPRWTINNSSNAGGTPYEARCQFQNINPGTTYFITPMLNTVGLTQLRLSFRHMFDDYGAGATLKIMSTSDGITWTDEAWSRASVSNTNWPPELVNTTIVNNLGVTTTQVAFVVTGNLFQIDNWYVDNVNIREMSSNADLATLTSSQGTLSPAFNPATLNYEVDLPTNAATVPTISATKADDNATLTLTQATSITGLVSERTANAHVVAENGVATKDYNVLFNKAQYYTSTNSYNYGSLALTETGSHNFAVSNTGTGNLKIESVTITGTDASEFILNDVNTYPYAIAATTGLLEFSVDFVPTTKGLKTATVNVKEIDNPTPFTISLTGYVMNNENDIISVDIPGNTGSGVDAFNHEAVVTMPYGTDVTNLIPTIVISPNATINPASGIAQDFSTPVIYTVTAEDGTPQDWTVSVELELNHANDIISFTIPGQVSSIVDGTAHTVSVTMPYGTDVTNLTPSIVVSLDATINPASGVAQDFTNPVTYTVTAQNGATQDWIVTVVVELNNANDIISFDIPSQVASTINDISHTVTVTMPNGTDVTNLVPTIVVSPDATINPPSGVAQDFTNPVTYTVTAQNGATQDWVVTVNVEPANGTDILAYSIAGQVSSIIDGVNYTVDVVMPYGTDVTNLIATFVLSTGATAEVNSIAQISGVTANDFTNPVTYTVWAQNGIDNQDWTVTVTVQANDENDILAFSVPDQAAAAVIDDINHTVYIEMPNMANRNQVATFTLSGDATAYVGGVLQISGVTSNDFTNPVTYTIFAQNGVAQDWVVTLDFYVGTSALNIAKYINVFPNPVTEKLSVDVNVDAKSLSIININGQVLVNKTANVANSLTTIDVSSLPAGVYFVKVVTNETSYLKRFVKE